MKRRHFFLLPAAMLISAAPASAELYPINRSDVNQIPQQYRKRRVRIYDDYAPGTIIVDTRRKFLYYVTGDGEAIRYGIGVGRQGFSWSGEAKIQHKAKWPRWTPPASMVKRDKFAAEWADGMPGGPRNPLGARALYLFQGGVDTLYRIHGTFVPSSIGKAVSSGCIRMLNVDVADLYERVSLGARVIVLQGRSVRTNNRSGGFLADIFRRKQDRSEVD
jgi:lipoprotein-anchoring transpeptidase ErfK/SrfK